MKIRMTKSTVRELLATLEGRDPNEEVTFSRANPKTKAECWCGCGGLTGGKFVPGHDSKFHGEAKRVARAESDHDAALHNLPHRAAVDEFLRHIRLEMPKHEARVEAKTEAKRVREAEKAEKAEAREAAHAAG